MPHYWRPIRFRTNRQNSKVGKRENASYAHFNANSVKITVNYLFLFRTAFLQLVGEDVAKKEICLWMFPVPAAKRTMAG